MEWTGIEPSPTWFQASDWPSEPNIAIEKLVLIQSAAKKKKKKKKKSYCLNVQESTDTISAG